MTVTIDDYLPCFINGGPYFAHCSGNELWVSLLEKAFAKVHGDYYTIEGNQIRLGMFDLTGCPISVSYFPTEKDDFSKVSDFADELFEKIQKADEEGHLA